MLAVLVPVLRRPHRVRPLLDSLAAVTPEPYRVVFICDPDDRVEIQAVANSGHKPLFVAGNYAQKVNAAVEATDEPLLFFGADDLHFWPEWLERSWARMTDEVGVVGTNDLCNKRVRAGDHGTHFLVARWYAELGGIDGGGPCHEGYDHSYYDDEFVGVAKHRKAWDHAPDSIVEHLHPDNGTAEMDSTYTKGRENWRLDRGLFMRRRKLWTRRSR